MAVVGHLEWSEFVYLDRLPGEGEVTHARAFSARPGGGGAVAAVALAALGASVDFFTALGRDPEGEATVAALSARGVRMHVAWREQPTRRAITSLIAGGERTIVVIGPRLQPGGDDALPWERLDETAGVYLTAGDPGAVRQARRAGVLVATSRTRGAIAQAGVPLDALVFSAADAVEADWAARLEGHARLIVATEGDAGGRWWGASEGRWEAVAPAAPVRDHYGAGDSFAAGFMAGLAGGGSIAEAAALGARAGAYALTRAGAP